MKVKVQFTFEAELPQEHEDLATIDWGDEQVNFSLEEVEGNLELVLMRRNKTRLGVDWCNLKTECIFQDILEVV